jgi:O-antigen/teichoic acid export membrane protein
MVTAARLFHIAAAFAGQGGAALSTIAGLIALTHLLDTDHFADFVLVSTVSACLESIAGVIGQGVLRFAGQYHASGTIQPFWQASRRLLLRSQVCGILLGIGGTLACLITPGFVDYAWIIACGTLLSIPNSYASNILFVLISLDRPNSAAVIQGIGPAIRLGAIILIITIVPLSGPVLPLAILFGACLTFILAFATLHWNRIGPNRDTDDCAASALAMRKQMLDYSLPFFSWQWITIVYQFLDRWMVEILAGSIAVSAYAIGSQLGFASMNLIGAAIRQHALPSIFQSANPSKAIIRLCLIQGCIGIVAVAMWVPMQSYVLNGLLGHGYSLGNWPIPILLVSGTLFSIGQHVALYFQFHQRTDLLRIPLIGTYLIGILAEGLLAWLWGAIGACLGVLIFSICYVSWLWMQRTVHLNSRVPASATTI